MKQPTIVKQPTIMKQSTDIITLDNCLSIEPNSQRYEKNWIPIQYQSEHLDQSEQSEQSEQSNQSNETFIYKWNDLCICNDNGEYVKRHTIIAPLFNRLKGSTIFCKNGDDNLIGLVHFSDEGEPRRYSHMLVLLDKVDLRPIKYSCPFYFDTLGIEFCIGFTIVDDEYLFWISRHDREPLLVRIKCMELPL